VAVSVTEDSTTDALGVIPLRIKVKESQTRESRYLSGTIVCTIVSRSRSELPLLLDRKS